MSGAADSLVGHAEGRWLAKIELPALPTRSMTVVRATRWRVVQLLVFCLVGGGLVVAETYAPSVGVAVEDPMLSALGVVLVGYAVIAAVWEAALVAVAAVSDDSSA